MTDQGDYTAVANVLRKDLKKMLRDDNIRLWDPPYTNPKTHKGSFSKDFLEHYLQKLENRTFLISENLHVLAQRDSMFIAILLMCVYVHLC